MENVGMKWLALLVVNGDDIGIDGDLGIHGLRVAVAGAA